jgi:hypothetical protein
MQLLRNCELALRDGVLVVVAPDKQTLERLIASGFPSVLQRGLEHAIRFEEG